MRVPPGARAAELLALYQSGELARHVAAAGSMLGVAKAIGWTPDMLKGAWDGLKRAGKMPGWSQMAHSEIVHQVAANPAGDIRSGTTIPNAGTPMPEGGTRWPSVAAFDAGDPPLPAMPEGHRIRGVSTLVDAYGATRAQWIKTTKDDDVRQDWLKAIRDVMAEPRAELEPLSAAEYPDEDTLVVLPVGDPHVGLKAWREDAGENFDLKIAERNLVAAFRHLVALAPPSKEALIIFIGDNTHSDGQSNTTTRGTRVDVDDRTIKMMRVVISCARQAIDISLAKFGRVTMIVERGNHDELLSAMLALALSLLYENDPRVTIDTSPEVYHWYRFGANLIGTHHGDKAKPDDLLAVMAVDRKVDWGETKHRRWYTGHLHHLVTKEVHTVIIETLPTLAASDAWHRSMGYRAGRAMYMDIIHREHGHINRHVVGIGQLQG